MGHGRASARGIQQSPHRRGKPAKGPRVVPGSPQGRHLRPEGSQRLLGRLRVRPCRLHRLIPDSASILTTFRSVYTIRIARGMAGTLKMMGRRRIVTSSVSTLSHFINTGKHRIIKRVHTKRNTSKAPGVYVVPGAFPNAPVQKY